MTRIPTLPLALLLAAAGLVATVGAINAQGAGTAPAAPAAGAVKSAPSGSATAAKSKSTSGKTDGASSGGGSEGGGIGKRIDSLEEQIVDMQVVIGTLESLAKSGVAASAAAPRVSSGGGGGLSSNDAARLDGIETQIRALTAQVEQLAEQVRAQGARRSEALPPPRAGAAPAAPTAGGFGATSVAAGEGADGGDPIGGLIAGGGVKSAAVGGAAAPGSALPPVAGGAGDGGDPSNPKQLYETAYGYLLQQDYGAAEAAFDDFLKKYPNDSLSGNAQYWLGESFYVRGQYKQAASAFLKGYQTYGKSAKAPDSLLKLAMSLDKLGQKDAACSSYGELGTRFPSAPPHIKSRASSERTRLGCG